MDNAYTGLNRNACQDAAVVEAIADCNAIADMLEQAGFHPVHIVAEARFLHDEQITGENA